VAAVVGAAARHVGLLVPAEQVGAGAEQAGGAPAFDQGGIRVGGTWHGDLPRSCIRPRGHKLPACAGLTKTITPWAWPAQAGSLCPRSGENIRQRAAPCG